MKISLSTASITNVKTDLLAVGARASKVTRDKTLKSLDEAMGGALFEAISDEGFEGQSGEVLKVPTAGDLTASWVVVVGLGKGAASPRDAATVAVEAARSAKRHKSLAIALPSEGVEAVRAAAEGAVTGAYRYDRYLTGDRKPKGGLRTVTILSDKSNKSLQGAVGEGQIVGEGINIARDLVNGPPNDMNAPALANEAKKAARSANVQCTVWNKKQIEKAGMTLLLAVNQGSITEPRFIHMKYTPRNAKARVVFVGKGLTFDSGGLCLKPPKGMADMKCDMSGAAATIGIVYAAAKLKLPIEVHGVIGATDNMTGGNAFRPGDVFPSLDGKTVEIVNTDAEGRLVLADALAYARELEPDYMIDHATLTGACIVALGQWTAGLFAGDDKLGKMYADAASDAGESFWRMPLNPELRETLDSAIADLKHVGGAHGGAITAALFLKEFVGNTKWAHCDIAGPAFLDSPHALLPKGGTGFGVSTGVSFLRKVAGK